MKENENIPILGKGKYTFIVSEKGTVKAKIPLDELVRLRKLGYTQNALANHFNVSQKGISKALQRAEEKGLYKEEEIGTDVKDIIEEYDLTPDKDELVSEYKDEKKVKDKEEPKYRCNKCHNYLTPLKVKVQGEKGTYERHEVFSYKGKMLMYDRQPLSDVLIKAGYTHICTKCLIAYKKEERDYSKLEKDECPKCGEPIKYLPVYGDIRKLVPYCEKCDIAFVSEPEDEEKKESKTRVVKEGKSVKLETSVRD